MKQRFWAYVNPLTKLIIPSTIREKPGDSDGALKKNWIYQSQSPEVQKEFKQIRVFVIPDEEGIE